MSDIHDLSPLPVAKPRKLFIATPTHSGDVCHEYVYSLLASIYDLNAHGLGTHVQFLPGNCYVALARNQLVNLFLKTDCSDLLFVDADMGWQADAMRRVMLAAPEIVCGLYPFKTGEEAYPARYLPEASGRVRAVNGLVEMDGAPTGFMRIRRSVFAKMAEAYPERAFTGGDGEKHTDFFSCERVGDQWFGEDYRFCHLWRAIGGQVWVDPDIDFRHVGRKAHDGNWHKYMVKTFGEREEAA